MNGICFIQRERLRIFECVALKLRIHTLKNSHVDQHSTVAGGRCFFAQLNKDSVSVSVSLSMSVSVSVSVSSIDLLNHQSSVNRTLMCIMTVCFFPIKKS
jgi:hypothetical protein